MPELNDGTKANDAAEITVGSEQVKTRKKYRVTAVGGLFKNGMQIDRGQVVELEERTAANFMNAGDVEPLEDGAKDE